MKTKLNLLIGVVMCSALLACETTSPSTANNSKTQTITNTDQSKNSTYFGTITIDKNQTPTDYQLSVIHYILKNTHENHIHKMRGETDNRVFVHKNGQQEAVFNSKGKPVTNYNRGSYNYYANAQYPIKHFNFDMLPWIMMGNSPTDPTTMRERLYYYSLDLSYGIQSYIFNLCTRQFLK